jgi:hypothetical protein
VTENSVTGLDRRCTYQISGYANSQLVYVGSETAATGEGTVLKRHASLSAEERLQVVPHRPQDRYRALCTAQEWLQVALHKPQDRYRALCTAQEWLQVVPHRPQDRYRGLCTVWYSSLLMFRPYYSGLGSCSCSVLLISLNVVGFTNQSQNSATKWGRGLDGFLTVATIGVCVGRAYSPLS